MRTLLVTLEFPPFFGGISNYYGNICRYWPHQDLNKIFVLNNNDKKLVNPAFLFCKWLPSFWAIYQAIKKEKINHVIVGHILPLGTVVWLLSLFMDFDYTIIMHGMDFAFTRRIPRKTKLADRILTKAAAIICGNNYLARQVRSSLSEIESRKIYVVNAGIDDQVPPSEEIGSELIKNYRLADKFVLFSIGRLVMRKGFDQVIELMPDLIRSYPQLYYFIAGTGPDEKILKKIAADNSHIIFLDQVDESEKWAWLKICDTFIMPARNIDGDYEGFGIVYLEANLCGKPVIAGDSGGVADAVLDGSTGLLVNPLSKDEIRKAIELMITDTDLRKKLGESGKKRAVNKFRWPEQVRLIFDIVRSVR